MQFWHFCRYVQRRDQLQSSRYGIGLSTYDFPCVYAASSTESLDHVQLTYLKFTAARASCIKMKKSITLKDKCTLIQSCFKKGTVNSFQGKTDFTIIYALESCLHMGTCRPLNSSIHCVVGYLFHQVDVTGCTWCILNMLRHRKYQCFYDFVGVQETRNLKTGLMLTLALEDGCCHTFKGKRFPVKRCVLNFHLTSKGQPANPDSQGK